MLPVVFVLMIAHSLSTVIHADRIIVIGKGRILDQGSHQELMERCEAYRRLYEAEISY